LKTCNERKGRLRRRLIGLGAASALCAALLAACGGGGGGGGSFAALPTTTTTPTGGGSSTPSTTATTSSGSTTSTTSTTSTGTASAITIAAAAVNVAPMIVDNGPAAGNGATNIPYVSVTICPPDGGACQTIDHVIVDTASEGLRLVASAVANRALYRPVTDSAGNGFAECAQFASGFSWGSVKEANLTVAGETAAALPFQIIGDPDYTNIPATCASAGTAQQTVASFGGNGILGLGVFRQDCGAACAQAAIAGTYYVCGTDGNCASSTLAVARQVANPVTFFATDNNGVLLQLPAIPDAGASNVVGALVFGIGTRTNNALGSAKAYGVSAGTGGFAATVSGRSYADSFVDSGSNFYFFDSVTLPQCGAQDFAGFYCPVNPTQLAATFTGSNGTTGAASIIIANAITVLSNNASGEAFNNVGATMGLGSSFDFGLPFFYGRNMFTAIEGATTPAGSGPYVAF
jgi:hypothetical protein